MLLLVHVIIHEAGHLVALNFLGNNYSKFVFARGSRVGVAHGALSLRKRRFVALCGPAAGVAGAQTIALGMLVIPFLSAYAALIALSGVIHVYSLVPWCADGRQVWQRRVMVS